MESSAYLILTVNTRALLVTQTLHHIQNIPQVPLSFNVLFFYSKNDLMLTIDLIQHKIIIKAVPTKFSTKCFDHDSME